MFQYSGKSSLGRLIVDEERHGVTAEPYYNPQIPLTHYSDSEDSMSLLQPIKKRKQAKTSEKNKSIDAFFNRKSPPRVIKTAVCSSVGKPRDNGISYISLPEQTNATHLIKIELYDLKKLQNLSSDEHWKHAEVRIKYATNDNDEIKQTCEDIIYDITKNVSENSKCKTYFYNFDLKK